MNTMPIREDTMLKILDERDKLRESNRALLAAAKAVKHLVNPMTDEYGELLRAIRKAEQ
jgi:hypothetical protein